jgi:hypothetical protein
MGRWGHGPKILTNMLLYEHNPIGKRFHAVYRAERDITHIKESDNSFWNDISNQLSISYLSNSERVYTIIGDIEDHLNVAVFHRFQQSQNFFLHAPILLHWYKSLWLEPDKSADDTEFIHLSKLIRHIFSGDRLYKHIVDNLGGDTRDATAHIMENTNLHCVLPERTSCFHHIRELPRKHEHRPGLVSVVNVLADFHDEEKVSHTWIGKG